MAFDLHKNFAYSLVATAPSPGVSGTSLVVTSGEGDLFPAAPFNATIWAAGVQPLSTNGEIVRVTAVSTDTLTIVRAQESTTARTVVVGDQIAATITVRTLTDVEKWVPSGNDLIYSDGNVTVNGGVLIVGSNFSYTPTTETLALSGVDTEIKITGITNEPTTPGAGVLTLYTKAIATKMVLKQKEPSGLDTPLQSCLYQNGIQIWTPTNVTAGNWQGDLAVSAGTYSLGVIATTNTYTSMRRSAYANVPTSANQVLGVINTNATWLRGNAAGIGGFFYIARAGFDVWTNGGRFFAGLATGNTVISANPSALNNTCGFMVDSADNGLIYFGTKDGTTSNKVSTGLTIVSGKGYDCYIFCAPNGTTIGWRIVDINTGTEASNSTTTNLPVNTTLLKAMVLGSNAALTPVTSINVGISRIYIESDY